MKDDENLTDFYYRFNVPINEFNDVDHLIEKKVLNLKFMRCLAVEKKKNFLWTKREKLIWGYGFLVAKFKRFLRNKKRRNFKKEQLPRDNGKEQDTTCLNCEKLGHFAAHRWAENPQKKNTEERKGQKERIQELTKVLAVSIWSE